MSTLPYGLEWEGGGGRDSYKKNLLKLSKSLPRQVCEMFLFNDRWCSHMERQSVAVLRCPEFLNSMIV